MKDTQFAIQQRNRLIFFIILFLFTTQFVALCFLGQPLACSYGTLKFWEGSVNGFCNSQQFTDWYTCSHIIHGFIFYALTKLFFPRLPTAWRLVPILGLEVSWEIFENTPFVIERYRTLALSLGYSGDSIINSLTDSLSMVIGFCIAWRFPVWVTIGIALAMELWVAYEIRDNATLTLINLIHTFPAIKAWQAAVTIKPT